MNSRKILILTILLPLTACVQPAPEVITGVPVTAPPPAAVPAQTPTRVATPPAQPRTSPARGPVTIPEAPTYSGSDAPSNPVVIDLYD
ncbi:hypothetical protein IQ03_01134 [Gemmobacter caeni]|jgi:hypothetical protein|uniref:Lipoprotein n=1 Tax=Gemmobacter caeni TaxID=589035 RepID=A0A2T6B8G0_9RHOB|nr:hypothetical protein C8N34_102123 [Gemmobacter caeni]TWJ02716.1 hypothetical protein IQ03_01134 [Gemmobacter caeni]